MHSRSLRGVFAVLKSWIFQALPSGWSVPMDEIFVPARLPSRYIEASGRIPPSWLRTSAQSAASKWHDEVCGGRGGRIQHVTIDKVEICQQLSAKTPKTLHVTARYCGRAQDGAFRFRHDVSDPRGTEIMRYVSQVAFNPEPDLPAYPAVHVVLTEVAGERRQDRLMERSAQLAAADGF